MNKDTRPVFFDQTGTRSIVVYLTIGVLLSVLLTFGLLYVPTTLSPETFADQPRNTQHEQTVEKITSYVASNNVAVIGDGPFVRVIEIRRENSKIIAKDPFSQHIYGPLSTADVLANDNHAYALQRFGQTHTKKLALTYDDGPDATYTPQLLDLLSRESVPATFFVLGSNTVQYPEVANRIVHEGHTLGNHTFSHIDFDIEDHFRGTEEIIQTGRIIRATTHHSTKLFRTPYIGNSSQSLRDDIFSIATAHRLGYIEVYYTHDSVDWQLNDPTHHPTYPNLDTNEDVVVLLHDGGGNREKTLLYTEKLIQQAKSKGYTFTTIDKIASNSIPNMFTATKPDTHDEVALATAQGLFVWPRKIIVDVFIFSIVMIFLTTVFNTICACLNLRTRKLPIRRRYHPRVGVIIPAYNEGVVLEKTVRSLRNSSYKNIEIIMVDDGSTDNTWQVMQKIVRRYKHGIVRAINQKNTGKSGALNNAIAQLDTEIIVCLDADTIFERKAIAHLVKHFELPNTGAVAGVVKVGNIRNYVTRWQALEYTIGIALERNAQNLLGAITIVPGACGAWRRQAVVDAGGFSHRTLAEDCDLTLAIHQLGYRVIQENEALSYTEAPHTLRGLMKQRFRWTFGNFQALWVYRDLLFDKRHKMLGNFVMPATIITIIAPMLFWPLLVAITIQNIISGNVLVIVLFFTASLLLQTLFASIAIRLAHERYSLLLVLPIARFIFGPIRTYIMYRSLMTAFVGRYVGWNKLIRSGTVSIPTAKIKHAI